MTPIPPPGKRARRPQSNIDWLIFLLIVMMLALGMFLGYTFRGMTAQAAELIEVTPTNRTAPLQEIDAPIVRTPGPTEEPEEPELISLGTYTITAYCPCEICCGKWSNPDNPTTASGAPAVEGVTVASDWLTLPKGTEIYIDGVGTRTVQDKPAKWIVDKYDGKIIDLYFDSHQAAWNFGKQELEVWVAQ